MPVTPYDTTENSGFSYGAEGISFSLKLDSNVLYMLTEALGEEVEYSLEYIGDDCEGFKLLIGRLFSEPQKGILQLDKLNTGSSQVGVGFNITSY